MEISLAPLQGYTEYPFRNALSKIIGGVDKFYTPFIRFENDGSIRNKHIKDILPENNNQLKLIPQILVNNAKDFLHLTKIIEDLGYTEVNWNLGCPFPMVTKRKLGSGLLSFPEMINNILDDVVSKTKLKISVKLRSGYTDSNDINNVIEVLNSFSLTEIIYHPRIGKQMYKGLADIDMYLKIQPISKNKMAYNGDIDSSSKFINIKKLTPDTNHFMIGRALISNPFLALEIKTGKSIADSEKRIQFSEFYNYLFEHYSKTLSGDSHTLNKIIHFWEYFSQLFENNKAVYKIIKKSKTVSILKDNAELIIRDREFKVS